MIQSYQETPTQGGCGIFEKWSGPRSPPLVPEHPLSSMFRTRLRSACTCGFDQASSVPAVCLFCKRKSQQVSAFSNECASVSCLDYSEQITDNMSLTH